MNKEKQSVNNSSSVAHRKIQRSTTLNRKYVKRPSAKDIVEDPTTVKVNVTPKVKVNSRTYAHKSSTTKQSTTGIIPTAKADIPAQPNPYAKAIKARKTAQVRTTKPTSQPSAKELKDRAIQQAMRSVATMDTSTVIASENLTPQTIKSSKVKSQPIKAKKQKTKRADKPMNTGGNGKRFVLAFACAAACVIALALFVNANMPDISVRVAAMQTGIEASYPSYVPREYSLSNILSEEGKITMEFTKSDGEKFTLTEQKSSWDSNALLNNYVKENWQDNYITTHEQGVTIYIKNSSAAWVNGGILYTLEAADNTLTKKQINSIVVSL
ncbi:DUF4367 domain-containing protein [Candidatus Saccharibacteria bacterium]|nr:DUF4367 domain-containing protein [Candidatus Saccharibacteria bacterium]